MVVLLWGVAALGLLLALLAFASIRRLSRKLDTLTQSYWELRYDYTRLRSQVSRQHPEPAETPAAEPAATVPSTVSFVPLSTIRKKTDSTKKDG